MPIASYLVYPVEGRGEELRESLASMAGCTVVPSTNAEVSILVTETADWAEDKALHEVLRRCESLQCLVLVMGEVDGEMTPAMPEVPKAPLNPLEGEILHDG